MTRPVCITCNAPAAINYNRKGKTYYRRFCDSCLRQQKQPNPFKVHGYIKKDTCDHCGYQSKYPESFLIWYLDIMFPLTVLPLIDKLLKSKSNTFFRALTEL